MNKDLDSTASQGDTPSAQYRLMIYFAVATLLFYETDIVFNKDITPHFMEDNKDVIARVFQEGINIFNYELSHEQMRRACAAYLSARTMSQSVKETKAYTL